MFYCSFMATIRDPNPSTLNRLLIFRRLDCPASPRISMNPELHPASPEKSHTNTKSPNRGIKPYTALDPKP